MPSNEITQFLDLADQLITNQTGKGSVTRSAVKQVLSALATIVDTKPDSVASHYKGKFVSVAALVATVPVGTDGDYAIVSAEPTDLEYIWDSDHSAWVASGSASTGTFAALTGLPADNAALNGSLTGLQNQITALSGALIPHPTYNAPAAGLSSTQDVNNLEVGAVISIPLTSVFYQNDGGLSSSPSIKKNGVQVAAATNYNDNNVTMSLTAIVYSASFAYAQGNVKNNLIGVPDPTGRIAAGSVISNTLSYQGYHAVWFGPAAAEAANSADARGLTKQLTSAGNQVHLQTGTVYNTFQIIIPDGLSILSVLDNTTHVDITADYALKTSAFVVNDAAGVAINNYKKYVKFNPAGAYLANHEHIITIG